MLPLENDTDGGAVPSGVVYFSDSRLYLGKRVFNHAIRAVCGNRHQERAVRGECYALESEIA